MASVSPKLVRIRTGFERVRSAQESFVLSLPNMHRRQGNKSVPMGRTQRERLCEMSFVILFTAWEEFLESSFEVLVVDATLGDFRKRNRVLVVDSDTVHDLLRGSRKYTDWADHNSVRERAKVFFREGEPFESALSSAANDLKNMRIIRNRCVHYSQHAAKQYKDMIRRAKGAQKLIVPGALLFTSPPTGLSTASGASTFGSVFELYGEILSTISSQIVTKGRR